MSRPILFLAAMIELWIAIPFGLKQGIAPGEIALIAAFGAILGGCLICLLGSAVRDRLVMSLLGRRAIACQDWIRARPPTAVAVVGVLAPGLLGSSLTAALGIGAGLSRTFVMKVVSAGVIAWTLVWYAGAVRLLA